MGELGGRIWSAKLRILIRLLVHFLNVRFQCF